MLATSLRHLQLPTVIQNQLVIAQSNGGLEKTVIQCGKILQEKVKQQSKLKDLLAYTVFVISFLLLMIVALKLYILPQLAVGSQTDILDLIMGIFLGLMIIIALGSIGVFFIYEVSVNICEPVFWSNYQF